jgi:2'-5' RNA ligase
VHLTLKFLGDVDIERLGKIRSAVGIIAGRVDPFILEVADTGVFPDQADPRILWLGIKAPELSSIVQHLEDACEHLGFEREKRYYRPHLTIARIRDARGAREVIDTHLKNKFPPSRFEVSRLAVYESQLLRSGSVYSIVSTHDLGTL